MRFKIVVAAAAVAILMVTYLAGYLPQRRARAALEGQVQTLQQQAATAQARLRMGELLGHALTLKEVAERRNYGQALEMSSAFFDAVRTDATSMTDVNLLDALDEVLGKRDEVTAALATSEPNVTETLHGIEVRLRRALSFVMPPSPPPAP